MFSLAGSSHAHCQCVRENFDLQHSAHVGGALLVHYCCITPELLRCKRLVGQSKAAYLHTCLVLIALLNSTLNAQ
jgi:hypothetical protein